MSQGAHLRKYGVQTTIDFELYEVDGVDLRTDWVPAAADCEVMKDEGASTGCTNTATDEGSTYAIVLTATEMQAARLVLKVVDAAAKVFLDKVIIIETYGNASAMHAFDLDTATVVASSLTGHTNQTADHTAGIADVPTVAEFNARTLVAASYFDPATDTVANVTTVATLTGHTAQTADHTAGIADIPTVAEFNARTLAAASYFDPAADAVANVTLCATTTTNTDFASTFAGITLLAEWLGALAGKQAANATAQTEIRATGAGSGTYDPTTDSTEAIRDTAPMGSAMVGTDSAATASALTTVDTVVDAIKVITDQFVFTTANQVDSNSLAISTSTAAANSMEEAMKGVINSTAKAGTLSITQMSTNLSEATNDHYIGRIVTWTSGVLLGQSSDITDYVGTNGVLTYTAVTDAPSATDSFVIT